MADRHDAFHAKPNGQPASIDFIDIRLPHHHAMFSNPPVHYDTISKQYVPRLNSGTAAVSSSKTSPRPALTSTHVMTLWNAVFPEAMDKFKSEAAEPKGRSMTPYSIRDKPSWAAVCDVLEASREKYEDERGAVGWLRKVRRRAADNAIPAVAATAKNASKLAPNGLLSITPVLATVEILADAVKKAAGVRQQVLDGLSSLTSIFADAELFLATFPEDLNVREASIGLTATTLDATERAVGFFIRNEYLRGGKAILMAGDYEKDLCESLEKIQAKSTALLLEAEKSHMYDSKMFSQETRSILSQILNGQQAVHHDVIETFNATNNLLLDYIQQQDRKLETARQQVMFLTIENGVLRSATPTGTPYSPPPHPRSPHIIPHAGHYISQGTLYDIMARFITDHRHYPSNGPNLDLDDLDFIANNKSELPGRQRAQAEQVINTALFRNFITTQSSTKLLIQWDVRPPRSFGGISPLSVVCSSMAQMLRGGSGGGQFDGKEKRFIPALWFCGRQIQQHPEHHIPSGPWEAGVMLACLILQILRQHSFDFTRSPPFLDDAGNLEALSVLSAPQHGGNEYGSDGSGRSLMVVDELLRVLEWLVRGLAETVTLFIIVDGVALYEREQFETEALRAFAGLLRLSDDGGTAATVKVLFTSVPGTDTVRAAFEEEDLILEVDGLSRSVIVSSEDRMGRELEGDGEGVWI